MHFGLALSTGHESLGEYLDVDLTDPEGAEVDLEALPERLDAAARRHRRRSRRRHRPLRDLPPGGGDLVHVGHRGAGPSPEALIAAVDAILTATAPVIRERKGKKVADDVRPGVLELSVVGSHTPTLPSRGPCSRPNWPPSPVGCGPQSCWPRSTHP